MTAEFFPPNEEELEQIIQELTDEMDEAESQAEWIQLNYELQQLLQKKKST